MSVGRLGLGVAVLAWLASVCGVVPVAAQQDSVLIVAGERYEAGALRERLLGRDYRELWTTPITVPVLDLATFDGGLTPVERGGGMQTRSLRLITPAGREYNFRSVDKEITQGLPPDLQETLVDDLLQDQVSSLHPAAAPIATGLLDAVGVLHPDPQLVVLPDDPRLGEFREEFGGMLGTIEVHANEAPDETPDFAGADEVEGEEDFFAELHESPEAQVDARAFLTSRLMSLLIADWDRHAGQFRWARFDSAGIRRWVPVPEDRDYAFADYDGWLLGWVGSWFPEAAPFTGEYRRDLLGLTQNSAEVDRKLLEELPWTAWAEVVEHVQATLTDEAIEAAVHRAPREYVQRQGAELIEILRSRRDRLDEVARRFYDRLATEAGVHATAADEQAEIVRLPGGAVRISLSSEEYAGGERPYFSRTYVPEETQEVRIHLYGGDDRAVVTGDARGGVLVRVIGGEGDDVLADSAAAVGRGTVTAFYDSEGDDEFVTTATTEVDRAPYEEPEWIPGVTLPPRDRGRASSWFVPWIGYEGTEGLIVGGGPTWTWYGFRRQPYAERLRLRAMYGLRSEEVGLDAVAHRVRVGSTSDLWLHARISGLEALRFHGFGNDTPAEGALRGEVLRYDQFLLEGRFGFLPTTGLSLRIGPALEYLVPDGGPAPDVEDGEEREALDAYGKLGVRGEMTVETRPERSVLGSGFELEVGGALFPAVWDLGRPFGRMGAEARGYVPLIGRSVLAARLGAARLWGEFPLLEAESLGGSENLRGFDYQRFTGDAKAYGGLELRTFLTRAKLIVRGDLGALAFVDAGRVYVDGRSAGEWHTGYGVGVWFETLGSVASLTYAYGEEPEVYLKLAFPF